MVADIEISQMTQWVGAVTGNAQFPAIFAGENYKITLSQITPSTFGFGDMALQDPAAVSITGGNVAVTALSGAITAANGGTGISTAIGIGELLIGNGADYTLGTLTAGTGISVTNGAGTITIDNSAPDQTVVLTGGTGISTSGTYPNFTITNSAPDQTVVLTGAGTTVVTGTYPNFTITSDDQYDGTVTSVGGTGTVNGITLTGTVTSSGNLTLGGALSGVDLTSQVTGTLPVANGGTGATSFTDGQLLIGKTAGNTLEKATLTAGTGVSISNGAGSITVTNSAPDQTVALTAGSGITVTGTYPNFTIASSASGGTVTSVDVSGGTTGLTTSGGPVTTSGTITLAGTLAVANGGTGATSLTSGYLVKGNGTSAVSASVVYDDGTNVGIGTSSPGGKLNVVDSSSNDAVRITQTGAGNALVVEDSANPDATPFVINADGRVISGSNTAYGVSGLNLPAISTNIFSADSGLGITAWLPGTAAGSIQFLKAKSATPGTYTVVASGDTIGTLNFAAADGAAFISAAQIRVDVDGTPGTNDMPGRLVFATTADGAASPTERMRITSAGNVGIGTNAPAGKLDVTGSSGSVVVNAAGDQIAYTYNGFNYLTASGATATLQIQASGASGKLTFATAGSERMRITAAGDVGIGTASPSSKLHVAGALTLATALAVANGGTNATATPTAGAVAYGTGTAYAFTSAGTAGQVLVSTGTTAPAFGGIDGGTF